ncbi:MAG: hypothetical protein FWD57_17210 [Polyangiaceae bacterium]|nr:hypothetical protein [Polyangiaceae bacterium]
MVRAWVPVNYSETGVDSNVTTNQRDSEVQRLSRSSAYAESHSKPETGSFLGVFGWVFDGSFGDGFEDEAVEDAADGSTGVPDERVSEKVGTTYDGESDAPPDDPSGLGLAAVGFDDALNVLADDAARTSTSTPPRSEFDVPSGPRSVDSAPADPSGRTAPSPRDPAAS